MSDLDAELEMSRQNRVVFRFPFMKSATQKKKWHAESMSDSRDIELPHWNGAYLCQNCGQKCTIFFFTGCGFRGTAMLPPPNITVNRHVLKGLSTSDNLSMKVPSVYRRGSRSISLSKTWSVHYITAGKLNGRESRPPKMTADGRAPLTKTVV